MGFYLIHTLEAEKKDAAVMARICELVFETAVRPGGEGEPGVWVDSQMKGFLCKRCGNCCRMLGNHCTAEDRQLWDRLGRNDILSWVKEEDGGGRYRIWIDPQTGTPAESCPFVEQQPGKDAFRCTIQSIKPLVCREYPFTKKHARHTGCKGFEPGNSGE
ncbi:MAG: YkgJ family cysteine cluster protein [Desulfobacterales bacterium]|nr:YkgJ family cysteine cluster protein [Desulfobacterales bacterium]